VFSNWFIERIKCKYKDEASYVQINGQIARPIPIHCSVSQPCPMSISMSMTLFALCVDPLLRILQQKLPGVRIGTRDRKTVVVA
jgi:hypothetical protein